MSYDPAFDDDRGILDIGVVRDSSSLARNELRIFVQEWQDMQLLRMLGVPPFQFRPLSFVVIS